MSAVYLSIDNYNREFSELSKRFLLEFMESYCSSAGIASRPRSFLEMETVEPSLERTCGNSSYFVRE